MGVVDLVLRKSNVLALVFGLQKLVLLLGIRQGLGATVNLKEIARLSPRICRGVDFGH